MKHLGLDYLDLYLIHQPYNDYYGAWRALEEMYAEGKIRAIGVDNFTQDKLADFVFWNKVKPTVNFIECNPFYQREGERAYADSQKIITEAWSPLSAGQSELLQNPIICSIAKAHNKSSAQVVLRWLTQRNIIPIVKSSNPLRMKENIDIFDFTLTDNEMCKIATLDTGHTCFSPRETGDAVEDFLKKSRLYKL